MLTADARAFVYILQQPACSAAIIACDEQDRQESKQCVNLLLVGDGHLVFLPWRFYEELASAPSLHIPKEFPKTAQDLTGRHQHMQILSLFYPFRSCHIGSFCLTPKGMHRMPALCLQGMVLQSQLQEYTCWSWVLRPAQSAGMLVEVMK